MIPRNNQRTRWGLPALCLFCTLASTSSASTLVPQSWLPGECIPQFATSLPVFGPGYNAALPRVNAVANPSLLVKMVQASRAVLPDPLETPYNLADNAGNLCPSVAYNPTAIWAYETWNGAGTVKLAPAFWPAVTVETRRFTPTTVKYQNDLPSGPGSLQSLISTDQTIHWADPLGALMTCMNNPAGVDPMTGTACGQPYAGPVPAVPHLHGGEVPSQFDGGPNGWWTPTGLRGAGYATIGAPLPNQAIYKYPNAQEPGTPWFHDHALGATRTNVYSGLAAFYFIRDPATEPRNLPNGAYEIEMAVQDRQFDTTSQLFFPDGSGPATCNIGTILAPVMVPCSNLNGPPTNPTAHGFWIPEFAGDTAVVNGSPWPVLQVEPRRYRFRLVDGSNARFYNLTFGAAPVYAVGADDGYLDTPVRVNSVFLAPGERADVIVDFTGLAGPVTVTNDAPVPYPMGLSPVPFFDPMLCPAGGPPCPADQPQMANIMRFDVVLPLAAGGDTSCNPATAGQCVRPTKTVRLTNGAGSIAPGVKVDKVRRLILKEHQGPGGPLEVLVNNTHWNGLFSANVAASFPSDGVSELPRQGSTELWEIINLTMDAHPMHTHLAQFQILNRETYSATYPAVWAAAFPLGNAACDYLDPTNPCPGFGPPLAYNNNGETTTLPNGQTGVSVVGGNPSLAGYLMNDVTPPAPEEAGWKDTAKAMPGQVMRILVRWTPTSTPVKPNVSLAGMNFYPFDPTTGPGYVWHCHIIDHEDNEMMRPYKVTK